MEANTNANTIYHWLLAMIRWLFFITFAILIALSFVELARIQLVWNESPSEPVGVWHPTHEPLRRGVYVEFYMPLKRIVAMAGDRVTFAAEGITVNGNPIIPKTAPEPKILQHCPFGTYTVPPNMIVAIGDHPDSWDARYLCWLPESLVFSTMQPVWVTR